MVLSTTNWGYGEFIVSASRLPVGRLDGVTLGVMGMGKELVQTTFLLRQTRFIVGLGDI